MNSEGYIASLVMVVMASGFFLGKWTEAVSGSGYEAMYFFLFIVFGVGAFIMTSNC